VVDYVSTKPGEPNAFILFGPVIPFVFRLTGLMFTMTQSIELKSKASLGTYSIGRGNEHWRFAIFYK